MKFLFFFITFLYLCLQTPFPLAMAAFDRKQFIVNVCKGTPKYDLCLSTLLANPKGTVTDLGLVMVDATNAKAVQTLRLIRSLRQVHPEMRRALHVCVIKYNAVVTGMVPSAVQALNGGQPKFAEDGMAGTAIVAESCERRFTGHGEASPLTEMNKVVDDLANVARAIIRMLL